MILGHWLVVDVGWDGTQLRETSALGLVPQMWPLTWLFQVIPLFFLVAGSANARSWRASRQRGDSYSSFVDRRLHRVLVPTGVYLAVVVPLAVLSDAGGGWGLRAGGAMLLQPLWFLAVYLVVVSLTPVTLAWHERSGWVAPALLVVTALAADVARIAFGWEWAGYLNVLTVWVLVYQLGFLEADGRISRRGGAVLCVGGLAATSLLVGLGPYPARMVGVAGDRIANMHPPTLALTALALAEVGAMVWARRWVEPVLQRERVWHAVIWVNLSIMTLYLWHQVALVGTARVVLAAGWPHPLVGSGPWWAARLGLVACAAGVLALVVLAVGRFERVTPPPPTAGGWPAALTTSGSVGLVALGLLALAGTRVTEPWVVTDVLGGLVAGPVVGVTAVASGAWVARSNRLGRPALGLVGAAALLAVVAAGYRSGVGPLPLSQEAAALLATLSAATLLVAGAVGLSAARSQLRTGRGDRTAAR